MHCGEGELCYSAKKNFVYWGESNLGVIGNSLTSLQGQKGNVSNKENSPSHP